jgi:hypothetical protein
MAMAVSMLGSACVHQGGPGVTLRKINANLVFGVKFPTPRPPAPAEAFVPLEAPQPIDLAFEGLDIPDYQDEARHFETDCNKPDEGLAIEEVATPFIPMISREAFEGIYQYKVEVQKKGATEPKFVGFQYRAVIGPIPVPEVKDTAETASGQQLPNFTPTGVPYPYPTRDQFTYQTIQPYKDEQVLRTTFKVNPDPHVAVEGVPVPTQRDDLSNPVTATPRYGEAERGITIMKQEVLTKDNRPVSTYSPTVGVLIFPTPGKSLEDFQGIGTDPTTGETIVHRGTTQPTATVNGCNLYRFDSWPVTSTQTVSTDPSTAQKPLTYDYNIGTQFNGLILSEKTTDPVTGDQVIISLATDYHAPLPESLKQ